MTLNMVKDDKVVKDTLAMFVTYVLNMATIMSNESTVYMFGIAA